MAKNKTAETNESVTGFIQAIPEEKRKADAFHLLKIMQMETGLQPKMWGPSIIGFGGYHYKYASGHEGDAPLAAFSPRKDAISLYTMLPAESREDLLQRLGKHKSGKSCVYIKKLSDVDEDVIKEIIEVSIKNLRELYPQ